MDYIARTVVDFHRDDIIALIVGVNSDHNKLSVIARSSIASDVTCSATNGPTAIIGAHENSVASCRVQEADHR